MNNACTNLPIYAPFWVIGLLRLAVFVNCYTIYIRRFLGKVKLEIAFMDKIPEQRIFGERLLTS